MPGAGKTTIGKLLAEKINIEFVDLDENIEAISNKSIEEIFEDGEYAFRKLETFAISELINKNEFVISTGGGVVKHIENMDLLRRNSIIVFIDRSVEDILKSIDFNKRPLLKNNPQKIYDLYEERYDLYTKFKDIEVVNDSDINTCINIIIHKIEHFV